MRILILFHNFLISTVLTGRVFDDIDEAEKNPGRTLVELKQQCGLYLSGDNDDRIRSSLLIHKIQMAKQHNSGGGKWRAGLSCFSIMSLDERNKVILPTLPPRRNQSDSRNELLERDTMGGEQGILIKYSEEQPVLASCQDLPCQIDWRNMSGKSYVTAIKDQGSCGSCWAFSAAAVLGNS